MYTIRFTLIAAILALAVCACANPPKVAQGTVTSYTTDTKTMVIMAEPPDNKEMTFSLKGAELGAAPAPKDLVRVAYKEEGGNLVAIRVMNITRQKELKTGGGH